MKKCSSLKTPFVSAPSNFCGYCLLDKITVHMDQKDYSITLSLGCGNAK